MRDKTAAAGRPDTQSVTTRSVDELWLQCQQRLVALVAHDLKGALNGVSVNIEVVRGRAGRPEAPIGDIQPYAEAASEQLGLVIKMTTALLSIGRGVRGPAEVSSVARQVVTVLEDTLRSDGAKLELVVEGGVSGATSAAPAVVRLALAETIMAAVLGKRDVSIRVKATAAPEVQVRSDAGFEVYPDIGRTLADAGVTVRTDGHGISMVFPAPTESLQEEA